MEATGQPKKKYAKSKHPNPSNISSAGIKLPIGLTYYYKLKLLKRW